MARIYNKEKKKEVLEYVKKEGITLIQGAKNLGIPKGTVYGWSRKKNRSKILSEGEEGLAQEKKGEEEKISCLPEEIQKIIIEFKKENPGAGLKRIDQELKGKYFLVIPRKRVREVLKREGILNEDKVVGEGEEKGQRRFEASRPNELWQMDVTNVYVKGVPVLYLVVVLDDHSRYCLAAELREEMSSDTMIEVLHGVVQRQGKPRKILTDQGRSFYTWSMEQTKFQEYVDGQGVEHIVSEPHSPQTAGKVERFMKTIKDELIRRVKFQDAADAREKISGYLYHYNHHRPHQSLGGKVPASRYFGTGSMEGTAQGGLIGGMEIPDGAYLVLKGGGSSVGVVMHASRPWEVMMEGEVKVNGTGK